MFNCGDMVLYGMHGVCKIAAIEERKVDRKMIEYYVLEPLDQSDSRFYIPTQNQTAVSKLRPMLTQQELDTLLHTNDVREGTWIADENARKQYYRELISSGDCAALIRMVHMLHKHREEQVSAGRKFHLCDENFLKDAQKLLDAEFALVLNIPADRVGDYVQQVICK